MLKLSPTFLHVHGLLTTRTDGHTHDRLHAEGIYAGSDMKETASHCQLSTNLSPPTSRVSAMPSPVEILQQPVVLPFSGKTASNRFMKAAMSERLATYSTSDPLDRGKPTDALIKVYEQWGKGGYGMS